MRQPENKKRRESITLLAEDGISFSISWEEAIESETALQQFRLQIDRWIQDQAKELEAILLRYNAFDMIANLMVTQLMSDPETYKESEHLSMVGVVRAPCIFSRNVQ